MPYDTNLRQRMPKRAFRPFILIAVCMAIPLSARLYDSGKPLSVAQTKYFDIIFPEDCRPSASSLAAFADDRYERLCAYFMCTPRPRITVTVTRDMHAANGYATILPENRITLYDYPMPISFHYSNYLDTLFTHELTHIVTLSLRDGIASPLAAVFGNWVSITALLPRSMVEGVAVHAESAEGFGRAHHPSVRQMLLQDHRENRFKSPGQAAGGFDIVPNGAIPYHYGGLFHRYLAERYGEKVIPRLWTNMAWNLMGIDGAMDGELKMNFSAVWDAFKETFRYTNGFVSNGVTLAGDILVSAMRLRAGRLWFYDARDDAIQCIDVHSPNDVRTVLPISSLRSFDVSPDGSLLLLETMPIQGGVVRSSVRFFDIRSRSFTARVIEKRVSDCSFRGEHILALSSRGSLTDIVLIAPDGSERVLAEGGETLYFGRPEAVDEKNIAFLASEDGVTTVRSLDTTTGVMKRYDIPVKYGMHLSVCEGKIVLACNNDDTFYKAAVIDGAFVSLMTNNVFGGVAFPAVLSNTLYYVSTGSERDAIMAMPLPRMLRTNAPMRPCTNAEAESRSIVHPVMAYNGFGWLLPRMWMPYAVPYLNTFGNAFVEAGFLVYGDDPIEENAFLFTAVYNYVRNFAGLNFTWQNTTLPIWWRLSISDTLASAYTFYDRRLTRADADLFLRIDLPLNGEHFFMRASACGIIASALTDAVSAYQWPYAGYAVLCGVSVGYNGITELDTNIKERLLQGRGIAFSHYYDVSFPSGAWKYETSFEAAVPFFPLRLAAYGAASDRRLFRPSGALAYSLASHYPSFLEYRDDTVGSWYYIHAEAKSLLFNIEIQQGILFLSLYVRRFYCTGGYRAAYYADTFLQSCYLRVHLAVHPYVPVEFYAEGNYAIRDARFGYTFGIAIPLFFL
mgnify:FL=1